MEPNKKALHYIVEALHIGWEIFGLLILCVLLGIKFDNYFHCSPLGLIIMSILGMIISIRNLIQLGGKK